MDLSARGKARKDVAPDSHTLSSASSASAFGRER